MQAERNQKYDGTQQYAKDKRRMQVYAEEFASRWQVNHWMRRHLFVCTRCCFGSNICHGVLHHGCLLGQQCRCNSGTVWICAPRRNCHADRRAATSAATQCTQVCCL